MARRRYPPIRQTAIRHIHWRLLRTYKTTYQSRDGDTITIRSIRPPTRTKTFRAASGKKKYRAIKVTTTLREVIIVARTKNRKKPVDQEELEELEALEDLDELEDEEEVEEEIEAEDDEEPEDEDEDDEDEDEAPKSRKRSKTKASKKSKPKSRASADGKVGTQEVAEHFGVNGRALRMVLRRHNVEKDPDSGRYEWSSLNHKEVVRIGKLLAKGEAKRAQREHLDELKAKTAKKKGNSKTSTKTKSKSKKRAVEDEDEDDE